MTRFPLILAAALASGPAWAECNKGYHLAGGENGTMIACYPDEGAHPDVDHNTAVGPGFDMRLVEKPRSWTWSDWVAAHTGPSAPSRPNAVAGQSKTPSPDTGCLGDAPHPTDVCVRGNWKAETPAPPVAPECANGAKFDEYTCINSKWVDTTPCWGAMACRRVPPPSLETPPIGSTYVLLGCNAGYHLELGPGWPCVPNMPPATTILVTVSWGGTVSVKTGLTKEQCEAARKMVSPMSTGDNNIEFLDNSTIRTTECVTP